MRIAPSSGIRRGRIGRTVAALIGTLALVTAGTGALAVVATTAASAVPTTWYVAPGGTASSCATSSSTNPFGTIQAAVACTASGDTVDVAPSGATPYAGIGAVSDNITIAAAGTGADARTVVVDVSGDPLVVNAGAVVNVTGLTLTAVENTTSPDVTNNGNLTLSHVTVTAGPGVTNGGGILNITGGSTDADLTVLNSAIVGNTGGASVMCCGVTAGNGGGIASQPGPGSGTGRTVDVVNTTIAGNHAIETLGGIAGGLYSINSSMRLVGDTITGNIAFQGGGMMTNVTIALDNTVVAGNTATGGAFWGNDCSGAFSDLSNGHNVIGDPTNCGGLTDGANGDQIGVADAGLAELADHGGPTDTVALRSGSPAIAAGSVATCTDNPVSGLDQRDEPRNATARGACDVGAFDTGGAVPYTSVYTATELRWLNSVAAADHTTSRSQAQHDATMFLALLAGQDTGTLPVLGGNPGTGTTAVTSTYSTGDNTAVTQWAAALSTDPVSMQRWSVQFVAWLIGLAA